MLRERQIKVLEGLLKGEAFEWSILVLDRTGQGIVAPLFRRSELMDLGIVGVARIEEKRERVEEARGVYLVEGTKENAEIIKEDVVQGKYREIDVIFTGSVQRGIFEDLAVSVGRKGEGNRIKRIADGLVALCVLHANMYTLNIKDSFMKKGISETIEIGLVSLLKGLDNPVIYTEKRYAGVCEEIEKKVKSLGVREKSGKKSSAVLVVGREIDLVTPVEHGWTYSALISDILEYDLNKVTVPAQMVKTEEVIGVETEKGEKVFDLNRFDSFWDRNQNEYFPEVAERVEHELGEYKADLAQRSIDSSSSKDAIFAALNKVPELSQRNKTIHTHMTLSLSLVEEIKKQKIDEIYSIENDTKKISDVKDELEDLLPKISVEHALRMCVVLSKRFSNEKSYLMSLAKKKGCSSEILNFLTQGEEEFKEGTSVVLGAASSILRNIKRILPFRKKLPLATAVENLLNHRSAYQRIDIGESSEAQGFSSVHVFVIGGGTFAEYKALLDLAEEKQIEITYGSTEILSPTKFISRIEEVLKKPPHK